MTDIVRSAAAYKHEYVTPPLRGDRYGSPLPTPGDSNIIENGGGSQVGSVPSGYSLDSLILDSPRALDTNGQNQYPEKDEVPIDRDLYARGEKFHIFFLSVSVGNLANNQGTPGLVQTDVRDIDINVLCPTQPPPAQTSDLIEDVLRTDTGLEILGGGMRRMVDLVNRLRASGIEDLGLPLPRIAVVGNQSAGKSSLIEAISGVS